MEPHSPTPVATSPSHAPASTTLRIATVSTQPVLGSGKDAIDVQPLGKIVEQAKLCDPPHEAAASLEDLYDRYLNQRFAMDLALYDGLQRLARDGSDGLSLPTSIGWLDTLLRSRLADLSGIHTDVTANIDTTKQLQDIYRKLCTREVQRLELLDEFESLARRINGLCADTVFDARMEVLSRVQVLVCY